MDSYIDLLAIPYPSSSVGLNVNPLTKMCRMRGSYSKGKWLYAVKAQFAGGLIKLEPSITYKLNPDTHLGTSLNLSGNKLTLKTGVSYNFGVATRLFIGLKGGFVLEEEELYWLSAMNVSFNFHSFRLSLPITLGCFNLKNNTYSFLISAALMALGIASFGYLAYRDTKKKK